MRRRKRTALAAGILGLFPVLAALAANPFTDVPTDSWAYEAVRTLAEAGVIQGVDGTYFQGNRPITRYEAAEMTAKAMAHEDQATVGQRALIHRLTDELADELNRLGVRVSQLEARTGNASVYGDFRIRYRRQQGRMTNDNSWDYRGRLRARGQVNDRTQATYGVTTDIQSFSLNGAADAESVHQYTDVANVRYRWGEASPWSLQVGRTDSYKIGPFAYNYGDVFDGVQLSYQADSLTAAAGYGKFKKGNYMDGVKAAYGSVEIPWGGGRLAHSAIGAYYDDFTRAGSEYVQGNFDNSRFYADDLWGVYTQLHLTSKWEFLLNYEKIDTTGPVWKYGAAKAVDDPAVWLARLRYGRADNQRPHSWDLWLEYMDADNGAYISGMTASPSGIWRLGAQVDNLRSWGIGFDYALAKGTTFSLMQSFGTHTKDWQSGNGQAEQEMTRAEFVFTF